MNEAKAAKVVAPHGWWTPQVRYCVACIALLMPGSFLVLPLLWVWQRLRVRR